MAEFEPGAEFHPHWHPQPEVYYVLAGTGTVFLHDKEQPIRPGSAVFIPGNLEHSVRNDGSELLRILYVFPVDSFAEVAYTVTGL